ASLRLVPHQARAPADVGTIDVQAYARLRSGTFNGVPVTFAGQDDRDSASAMLPYFDLARRRARPIRYSVAPLPFEPTNDANDAPDAVIVHTRRLARQEDILRYAKFPVGVEVKQVGTI